MGVIMRMVVAMMRMVIMTIVRVIVTSMRMARSFPRRQFFQLRQWVPLIDRIKLRNDVHNGAEFLMTQLRATTNNREDNPEK